MLDALFPEYFRPSDADFKRYWAEGVFVPDTNVLLELYRCSKDTADKLLTCLEAVKDRLWFPHQVAKEFSKNRSNVIAEQQAIFSDYRKALPQLCNDACETLRKEIGKLVKNRDSHPVIRKDDIVRKIKELAETHVDELKDENSLLSESSDSLLPRIELLMDKRIGPAFAPAQLITVVKDGCDRLKVRIPPGWKDYEEKKDLPDIDRCGDWFVWKQVLEYTKVEKRVAVIFVTADVKEDWWRRSHGRMLGADPRLIAELQSHSDCRFVLYTTEQFLKYSNAEENVIDEVRELRRQSEESKIDEMIGILRKDRFVDLQSMNRQDDSLPHDSPIPAFFEKFVRSHRGRRTIEDVLMPLANATKHNRGEALIQDVAEIATAMKYGLVDALEGKLMLTDLGLLVLQYYRDTQPSV